MRIYVLASKDEKIAVIRQIMGSWTKELPQMFGKSVSWTTARTIRTARASAAAPVIL